MPKPPWAPSCTLALQSERSQLRNIYVPAICNHSYSMCSSNESPSAASRGRQNSYTDFSTGRSTPESGGSAVSSTRWTPSAAVSPTVRDMDVGPPGDPAQAGHQRRHQRSSSVRDMDVGPPGDPAQAGHQRRHQRSSSVRDMDVGPPGDPAQAGNHGPSVGDPDEASNHGPVSDISRHQRAIRRAISAQHARRGAPNATREDEMICVGRCGEFGRCGNSTRTVCSRRQASLSCGP